MIFCTHFTFSQVDSITVDTAYTLPEVKIQVKKYVRDYHICIREPKTIFHPKTLNSLAELISQNTFLDLRNYGAGSLSTLSYQGHSTSQMNIVLDGFSIQSNMNGVYDLTLIPYYFVNEAYISSVDYTSDLNTSIGGNLNIQTQNQSRDKIHSNVALSYGSFNDKGIYGTLGNHWDKEKKLYSLFQAFYRSSDNDFLFTDLNQIGTPKKRMENAAFSQYGFLQNNHFELKDSSFISSKIWWVKNHREIPPTLTETSSVAFQNDHLFQGILSWEKNWNTKMFSKISTRYTNENIYYDSPIVQTQSVGEKYELRGEMNYNWNKNNLFRLISGYEYSAANVEDYETENPHQNKIYVLGKYEYEKRFFTQSFQVKEEIVDQQFSPVSLMNQTSFNFNDFDNAIDYIKINVEILKNYRLPTFNDLYWNNTAFSSGNPNLEPEKSWKEEIDFTIVFDKKINLYSSTSFFNSNVNNWILWTPNDLGKWTPNNVKKVTSRGINFSQGFFKYFSHWNIDINGGYKWTKTINTEVENSLDNILGKQLIYVPLHSGNFSLEIGYKDFFIKTNYGIIGKRFTTTDNSLFLPSYHLLNIKVGHQFNFLDYSIQSTFEIRNALNREYQVVANRPMPPIHFQGTIYFSHSRKLPKIIPFK